MPLTSGSRNHTEKTPARSTKERIMETAIALVAKHGYSSLTFGAIANNLNISKGLVNYHYPSRDTLVAAVLGYIGYDYAGYVSRITQAADADQKLTSFVTAVFRYALEYPSKVGALMEIGDKADSKHIASARSFEKIILEKIALYMQSDPRYARYDTAECQQIAIILKAAMDAYIIAWRLGQETTFNPDSATETLLSHIN